MSTHRVQYRERQPVTADILRDEQAYRLEAWQQHRVKSHGWGIVSGLACEITNEYEYLNVEPGEAVDPYGRPLILRQHQSIPVSTLNSAIQNLWDRLNGKLDDVVVCLRHVLLPGTAPCDEEQPTGTMINRWIESCHLVLAAGFEKPEKSPNRLLLSESSIDPPIDGAQYEEPSGPRLVPLARLSVTGGQLTPKQSGDSSFRQWASLVGERIESPSGRALLRLGEDPDADLRRFGVAIPHADGSFSDYRISIDRNHRTTVKGPVTVAGDLRLQPPSTQQVEPPVRDHCGEKRSAAQRQTWPSPNVLEFGTVPELPEGQSPEPDPWSAYRVARARDGSQPGTLRIELENPGDDADLRRYEFAVAASHLINQEHHFIPILSGANSLGTVTISDTVEKIAKIEESEKKDPATDAQSALGTDGIPAQITNSASRKLLRVAGIIREGPIQADLRDPRFAQRLFRESVAGELAVQLESPTLKITDDGFELEYDVEITNVGDADLRAIQVYQSLYDTPTELDPPIGDPPSTEIPGLAVPFKKTKTKPDPRLQFKIAELMALNVGESDVVRLPENRKRFPRFPPAKPTLAILAFGTAAVGSLVYAVRAVSVGTPGGPP